MEVTVIRPGVQTTLQDLGRPGHRAEGVPLGGAVDRFALRVANLLVGNPEDAPALEFALVGPELHFDREALVAVGGGDFGGPPRWQPVMVPAGTDLQFGSVQAGCRGYLAIAGGFEVPSVLGSASTYLRGGFGGSDGRALRAGDVLRAPDSTRVPRGRWRIDPRILPAYAPEPVLRVLPAAQAGDFGGGFFEAAYQVTARSDRMGVRLRGVALRRHAAVELRSGPVAPGTVQVPPDGQPIVLLADAQTIGGYPQIAHVITADLPLVAQVRPGDRVMFAEVSLGDAHELALAREHALAMLQQGLAQKFG